MLLRLPHSSVCVSDYLFPGETPYDSADSVLEILGFRPNIEFMDDEIELVAAPRPQPKVKFCESYIICVDWLSKLITYVFSTTHTYNETRLKTVTTC